MTNLREFQRLRSLFDALIELPESERAAALDRLTDLSAHTRAELCRLLELHDDLIDSTARPAVSALRSAPDADWIGRQLGPFVLERELGRGGMGTVFLAHRADGSVEQKVAIKLIRRERLDAHTLARFQLERQVLALLKHPNVATLVDLGEIDGAPYAVMEYVEGLPILEYCAGKGLGQKQRLHLFLEVCEAVAYAHRNMIVHRDIKPSNILVTAEGLPKLLDFGIAKPLVARYGTQDIDDTGTAQRYFSLHNAAPEQIRGEPMTVACDVYGLGVLLYELLAGKAPFDNAGKTPGEIERAILQAEPTPPSALAGDKSLRGDLDAIVLRALRKKPDERYASVDRLADDVRRHLARQPVSARKGQALYRAQRYVERHRVALSALVVVLLIAVGAAVALWRSALEATRQRDRARNATAFLVEAFRAADPNKTLGQKLTAEQILAQAQRSIQRELLDDPQLRAELLGSVAEVQRHLGAVPQAREATDAALNALPASGGDDPYVRARLLALRARVAYSEGEFDQASNFLEQAEASPLDAETKVSIALQRLWLGEHKGETKSLFPALRELAAGAPKIVDLNVRYETINEVAMLSSFIDEPQFGIDLLEHALKDKPDTWPADHPKLLLVRSNLASIYTERGRLADAERLAAGLVDATERVYGKDSPSVVTMHTTYGNILADLGRSAEAAQQHRLALGILEATIGHHQTKIALTEFNLAGALADAKDFDGAERYFRDSIQLATELYPEKNTNPPMFKAAYGLFLNGRHRFRDASVVFQDVLSRGEHDAEFKQTDIYEFAELGNAIAQYGVSASAQNKARFLDTAHIAAEAGPEMKQSAREQMLIAADLGLPVPKAGEEKAGQ